MKKNSVTKPRNNGRVSERVHIEFTSPKAEAVFIAGTFNDWRPGATPMIAWGEGRWTKVLSLPSGRYEYCLVVDGQWMPDPQAAEMVPNPFGTLNSVLKVGGANGACQPGPPAMTELAQSH